MQIRKLLKWLGSTVRVVAIKVRLGRRLQLPHGGKPVYLGRGARLIVAERGMMKLGRGAYVDDHCRLQVSAGARMVVGEGCYLNTNCRLVAAEHVELGAHTMLGPNVCVFDHDHVFDAEGVHGQIVSAPIAIGERCWLGAHALVTKGIIVADRICVGGGHRHALPGGTRSVRGGTGSSGAQSRLRRRRSEWAC